MESSNINRQSKAKLYCLFPIILALRNKERIRIKVSSKVELHIWGH